ncbi:MAG: methyltransferase domain-containing protein [Vulcanimicrobiota bacterium]
MKRRLLELLACPDCGGDIQGDFKEELTEGTLHCSGCERQFPVHQGVPSLLPAALNKEAELVADQFAQQWHHYREQRPEYRQQFLDWIAPVGPDHFEGKLVLDAGCGKGRHLQVSSSFQPELVVGIDLGEAAYLAKDACRDFPNVEVVRGDLLNLPFKKNLFDYAYSVGVLHHLPDPIGGFQQITGAVREGGTLSAWVYGRENNEWIVNWVDPFRKHVSGRLPRPVLRGISWILAQFLYWLTRLVYLPGQSLFPKLKLPLQAYLIYISKFPHREIETIVYDQLNPQIAFYIPRQSFEKWFDGFEETTIGWHNENSWRGFARKPEQA